MAFEDEYQRLWDAAYEELIEEVRDETEEEQWARFRAAYLVLRPIRHRRTIPRDHVGANQRLMEDYFNPNPRFLPELFRRRFRISQRLFIHTEERLVARYLCFRLRSDASGRVGLSTLQKCTSTIRQLAYGGPANMFDEYLHMGEWSSL